MYEIIDEKLKLANCSLKDLTLEQASHFLSQWGDGAKLRMLTMYVEPDMRYLVLNKDHANYEFFLKLAKVYLSASEKNIKKCKDRLGAKYHEEFRVMDYFREYCQVWNDLDIINYQYLDDENSHFTMRILSSLEKKQMPTCFLMSRAYLYGVINGKRAERARRKRGTTA